MNYVNNMSKFLKQHSILTRLSFKAIRDHDFGQRRNLHSLKNPKCWTACELTSPNRPVHGVFCLSGRSLSSQRQQYESCSTPSFITSDIAKALIDKYDTFFLDIDGVIWKMDES